MKIICHIDAINGAYRAPLGANIAAHDLGKIHVQNHDLRGQYAIASVTRTMQHAAHVSQRTTLFPWGTPVEYGVTSDSFTNPREERTKD